jgi:hypothetical protein
MIILAHRGLWQRKSEQNSIAALREALTFGFGIETDIRDDRGRVVISHDSPTGSEPLLDELLEAYRAIGSNSVMALNVKADGLHESVQESLTRYEIPPAQYFLFDMAPPDALGYISRSMPCFTRQSEIEPAPAFIDRASGVWLDCFFSDWIDKEAIQRHCGSGRRVALVSPELHGRNREVAWSVWRDVAGKLMGHSQADRLLICTDHPLEARAYFDGEDQSNPF